MCSWAPEDDEEAADCDFFLADLGVFEPEMEGIEVLDRVLFEASEADLLEAPPTEGFLGTETDLDTGDWLLWTE